LASQRGLLEQKWTNLCLWNFHKSTFLDYVAPPVDDPRHTALKVLHAQLNFIRFGFLYYWNRILCVLYVILRGDNDIFKTLGNTWLTEYCYVLINRKPSRRVYEKTMSRNFVYRIACAFRPILIGSTLIFKDSWFI
jgi:hypothetical protein